MTERKPLRDDGLSDLVVTQLQETGEVWLTSGKTLAQLLSLVDGLGIDPNSVKVLGSSVRYFCLRVTGDDRV